MSTAAPDCQLCGATQNTPCLSWGPQQIVRCAGCGLLTTLPYLSSEQLSGLYEQGYYSQEKAQRFRIGLAETVIRFFRYQRARKIHWTIRKRKLGPRILDIGCGKGYMLGRLQQLGYEAYGTQVSSSAMQFSKEKLGLNRIFHGDLGEAKYTDQFFDFISIYHVLEHLADPAQQLREVHRILKSGGLLYVEVPNAGSLSARWLKNHWLAYDLPRHRFHFTPKTLETLTKKCGFQRVRSEFFSLEYSPMTLLFSVVSAIFRDQNGLFRCLASDSNESPMERRPVSTVKLALELTAALMLAYPILFLSLLLALFRTGDTMAFYFKKEAAA